MREQFPFTGLNRWFIRSEQCMGIVAAPRAQSVRHAALSVRSSLLGNKSAKTLG